MKGDYKRIVKAGVIILSVCLMAFGVFSWMQREHEKKQAKRVIEDYILSFSPSLRIKGNGYDTVDPEAKDFIVFRKALERSLEKLTKEVDSSRLDSRFDYLRIVTSGNKCYARVDAKLSYRDDDSYEFPEQNYEILLTKQNDGEWKISKAISDHYYELGAYDSTDSEVIDLQYRLIGKVPKVEKDPRFVFSYHLKSQPTDKLLHRLDPIVYETNPQTLLELEQENRMMFEKDQEHSRNRNKWLRDEQRQNQYQKNE